MPVFTAGWPLIRTVKHPVTYDAGPMISPDMIPIPAPALSPILVTALTAIVRAIPQHEKTWVAVGIDVVVYAIFG